MYRFNPYIQELFQTIKDGKLGEITAVEAQMSRVDKPEVKAQILAELVEKVWPKVETGEIKPTIHEVLPITEAKAAHDILYKGQNVGKVVLTVGFSAV